MRGIVLPKAKFWVEIHSGILESWTPIDRGILDTHCLRIRKNGCPRSCRFIPALWMSTIFFHDLSLQCAITPSFGMDWGILDTHCSRIRGNGCPRSCRFIRALWMSTIFRYSVRLHRHSGWIGESWIPIVREFGKMAVHDLADLSWRSGCPRSSAIVRDNTVIRDGLAVTTEGSGTAATYLSQK
jgi:hypothetical protein